MTDTAHIFSIERPHKNLLTLYAIRSVLSGPFLLFTLPVLYFRYATMRYRFDDEGVSMRWGLLFRREVNLTFARIQDIHLSSGLLQRWLGLADVQIQTASGSATAEMTIEGLLEYQEVRDFLYSKMRGLRGAAGEPPALAPAPADEVAVLLRTAVTELRNTRICLERLSSPELPVDDGSRHV